MLHLKAKDGILFSIFFVLFTVLGKGMEHIVPMKKEIVWGVLSFGCLLGLVFEIYRRLEIKVIGSLRKEMKDQYRQTEALLSLQITLPMRKPLPPMRGWAISPDFANLLVKTIESVKPERVLELSTGVSTLVIAYALQKTGKGRLLSLENNADIAERSRQELKAHELDSIATVLDAPLRLVALQGQPWQWYDTASLSSLSEIDLLVIDGPYYGIQKNARYPALPLLKKYLNSESIILLDDADRPDERATVKRWKEEHPSLSIKNFPTEKGAVLLCFDASKRPVAV